MLNLLQALAAGCAIFLAFLVATVRQDINTIANRWLAAFLLLLGIFIIDDSLLVFGIYQSHPALIGFAGLSAFALSPTLYLCVAHFVAIDRKINRRAWWHLAPFLLFTVLSLPFLFSSPTIKLQELTAVSEPPLQLEAKILLAVVLTQTVGYWALSLRKLRRHRRNIENITASPGDINLDWLLYLLYGIGAMVLFWMLDLWYNALTQHASWATPGYFLAIWCLGYFALRQKEIYPFTRAEAEAISGIMAENDAPATAVRRQMFSAETLQLLKERLLEKMAADKPYLDSDLSLPGLAAQLQLSVHDLSQLVNEGFGENFAQFVNRYRVEESKRLLLSAQHAHLSMVGIAFEAGFNSKTAFNTAFKKTTGVAPSAFRNQQ